MYIDHKSERGFAPLNSIKSAISRFAKDESATVTIEFVLWVPVFVLILAITVDASVLFMTQANLWSIARDTTRRMATGALAEGTDAEDYARSRMAAWGDSTTVTTSINGTYATILFEVPIADVSPFNIVTAFTSGEIVVGLSQYVEPR